MYIEFCPRDGTYGHITVIGICANAREYSQSVLGYGQCFMPLSPPRDEDVPNTQPYCGILIDIRGDALYVISKRGSK